MMSIVPTHTRGLRNGDKSVTNYGTIKIPEPAYEYHNEQRKELGLTWEQYINNQEPETSDIDLDKVLGRIDDLENQLPRKVAEELR